MVDLESLRRSVYKCMIVALSRCLHLVVPFIIYYLISEKLYFYVTYRICPGQGLLQGCTNTKTRTNPPTS